MRLSKTTIRSVMGTSFTLLLLALFPAAVFSQQLSIQENSPEMRVKYLEGTNEALLFNLKYNNDSGNDFKLMVLSENGEVLFQKNYSGKKFRKKLKLPRLTDSDGVTFLIRSPQENVQLIRKVKVTSKVVDATEAQDAE